MYIFLDVKDCTKILQNDNYKKLQDEAKFSYSGRPRGTCGKQPKPEDKTSYYSKSNNKRKKKGIKMERSTVRTSRMGMLALTAWVLIPFMRWMPNFKPMAWTLSAIGLNPPPPRPDGNLWGSGYGRPHWSMLSKPYAPTPEPGAILRYHRKSITAYCVHGAASNVMSCRNR